jgi:hypothetical protein
MEDFTMGFNRAWPGWRWLVPAPLPPYEIV